MIRSETNNSQPNEQTISFEAIFEGQYLSESLLEFQEMLKRYQYISPIGKAIKEETKKIASKKGVKYLNKFARNQ